MTNCNSHRYLISALEEPTKSLELLKGLTCLFNVEMDDLEISKKSCEQNQAKTKTKLGTVLEDMRSGHQGGAQGTRKTQVAFAARKLYIELMNVGFNYMLASRPGSGPHMLDAVNLSVPQVCRPSWPSMGYSRVSPSAVPFHSSCISNSVLFPNKTPS